MTTIEWYAVDSPIRMNELLTEWRNDIPDNLNEQEISMSDFVKYVTNLNVFRRSVYATTVDEFNVIELTEVINNISDLRSKLRHIKLDAIGHGDIIQYSMPELPKYEKGGFSTRTNNSSVKRLMTYEFIDDGLRSLENEDIYLPDAINLIQSMIVQLGFNSINEAWDFVNSNVFSGIENLENIDDETIRIRKNELVQNFTLTEEDKNTLRANVVSIQRRLTNGEEFVDAIDFDGFSFAPIDIVPFDTDALWIDQEIPDFEPPPDPLRLLHEISQLDLNVENITTQDELTDHNTRLAELIEQIKSFTAQMHVYYSNIFNFVTQRKIIEDHITEDHAMWLNQAKETLDYGILLLNTEINQSRHHLFKLTAAIAFAIRRGEYEEEMREILFHNFSGYDQDRIEELWSNVVQYSQRGVRNGMLKITRELITV